MLFNSFEFLIFFIIVTTLFFILPHRWRWILLLSASCLFYMAFVPAYIFILVFLILLDYLAGIAIENSRGYGRTYWLVASLIGNIGLLGFFKYFNFFNQNVALLASAMHWNYSIQSLKIILPIGLSFHTFQSMSYTIEVYRGRQKAERHLGIYALYVMFYPQLVAGPIERPYRLLSQLSTEKTFNSERMAGGLYLMLWGFFKKLVIADRLAVVVNRIYDNPRFYTGVPLIIATYFFAFQIFCDFSGYSDIARGAARCMGFDLMNNFERPYFSKSVSEFWRRWHISLSSWFKDYLYIPLGGNRVGAIRWCLNILIVFLISGLWHGANWTFVVWGGLHGIYILAEFLLSSLVISGIFSKCLGVFSRLAFLKRPVKVILTFHLVLLGWIFFRARSIGDAFYVIRHIVSGLVWDPTLTSYQLGLGRQQVKIAVGAIAVMEAIHLMERQKPLWEQLRAKQNLIPWFFSYALLFLIAIFGYHGQYQFIYFQF